VDVVELVGEEPRVFGVVDFEVAVWGDAGGLASLVLAFRELYFSTYNSGWMGLKSVPITFAEGNW
jgi:hypothetical protein